MIGQGTVPTEVSLVAHYPMDGNFADATGDSSNGGVPSGVPEFGCGVDGTAVSLNGGNDFIRIPGGNNNVNRGFNTEDFTVSLYFKPIGVNGTQYLISKRDTNCNNQRFFAVRYAPVSRTVSVSLRQNNQLAQINYTIRNGDCWQHLTIARNDNRLRLYLNAEEVGEISTTSRVDIENTGDLLIGSTECRTPGEISFDGLIDDVRIYRRALLPSEVRTLYLAPDRIFVTTNRLFLGESLPVDLNSNCGVTYAWSPAGDLDDPTIQNPTITPATAGRKSYEVLVTDMESSCIARDSLIVQVIDPSTLDCNQIFLPKAFTPNGIGPVANETFGISNPFAISELLSFEIYDRYGSQMFQSTNAFDRWDGSFKGTAVQPGPIVWRVVYRCEGAELVRSGSAMVLR